MGEMNSCVKNSIKAEPVAFPVKVRCDGGQAGDGVRLCTFTYTVMNQHGRILARKLHDRRVGAFQMSPVVHFRQHGCKVMAAAPSDSPGIAYYEKGELILYVTRERPLGL